MANSKPKNQHFVPRCYLTAFVDQKTPAGQEPYVWIFDRNGKNRKKKSPYNIFKIKHLYTLQIKGKDKDYFIEETLSQIEAQYATIFREKISKKIPLNDFEHIMLCVFVSTMLFRTISQKENIEGFLSRLIDMTESMETQHGAEHKKSEELKLVKENAHKDGVLSSLPDITEILYTMNISFLCTKGGNSKFITSDDPCCLFNPDLQWQKFYGPGLMQNKVQLTMPLSPDITLCLCWQNLKGYVEIENSRVEELNRFTRCSCHKYFVASNSKKKFVWFLKVPLSFTFLLRILKVNLLKKMKWAKMRLR